MDLIFKITQRQIHEYILINTTSHSIEKKRKKNVTKLCFKFM